MSDRVLLAHLLVCAPCRQVGPLPVVVDLAPPPHLRARVLAAAHRHRRGRWRPRPARRVPPRLHPR